MEIYSRANPRQEAHQHFLQATIAYGVFLVFTLLGRAIQPLFLLVIVTGIAFPLIWAGLTRDWAAIGFTRRNWKQALLWGSGIGAGLGGLIYTALTSTGKQLPQGTPALQLLIGILLSFLVISPFQEFFFRGWLQPRFQSAFGKWTGLLTCSLCFALWDVIPLLNSSFSLTTILTSIGLMPASFSFAVLFGYTFQRTGNILAPWLAHGISVIGLLMTGQLVLYRVT
ncbi:MAG: CPBP family intramembrane metalloprotease [Chloroflexi bacterium]|nr:CPBP family intramembrane metalloprotease [Chloroflexota bacterium]